MNKNESKYFNTARKMDEELRTYYNAFFMQGTLAVIQEWLKNGCKEEPEQLKQRKHDMEAEKWNNDSLVIYDKVQ